MRSNHGKSARCHRVGSPPGKVSAFINENPIVLTPGTLTPESILSEAAPQEVAVAEDFVVLIERAGRNADLVTDAVVTWMGSASLPSPLTTNGEAKMTPAVAQAIAEIKAEFLNCSVTDDGGTYVVIDAVPLPEIYDQQTTWIGCHITDAYPYADVYPHFVRDDLSRSDGQGLGPAAQPGHTV